MSVSILKETQGLINLKAFIKSLYDKLCIGKLSNENLFKLTEFYVEYTHGKNITNIVEEDEKMYFKYMLMGWYIYNSI